MLLTPDESKRVEAVRNKLLTTLAARSGVELSGYSKRSGATVRMTVSVYSVQIGYVVDDGSGHYFAIAYKHDRHGNLSRTVRVGDARPSAIQAAFEFYQVKQAVAERAR